MVRPLFYFYSDGLLDIFDQATTDDFEGLRLGVQPHELDRTKSSAFPIRLAHRFAAHHQ